MEYVTFHFFPTCLALFVYVSPNCCNKIRTQLEMTNSEGLWIDMAASDESKKRITILPDKINEDTKGLLVALYGSVIEEIEDQVEARSDLEVLSLLAVVRSTLNRN